MFKIGDRVRVISVDGTGLESIQWMGSDIGKVGVIIQVDEPPDDLPYCVELDFRAWFNAGNLEKIND